MSLQAIQVAPVFLIPPDSNLFCRSDERMHILAEVAVRALRKKSQLSLMFEPFKVTAQCNPDDLPESQAGQIHQAVQNLNITLPKVDSGLSDNLFQFVDSQKDCKDYQATEIRVTSTKAGCLHPAFVLPPQIPVSVTSSEQTSYFQSSALVSARPSLDSKALPLDWILNPKKSGSEIDRLIAAFVRVEAHARRDGDIHFAEDVRQAEVALCHFLKGEFSSFLEASAYFCLKFFGKHVTKLQDAIIANRKARLGQEYHDWYDGRNVMRPDVPNFKKPPVADVEPNERIAALLAYSDNPSQSSADTPPGAGDTPIEHNAPAPVSQKGKLA